jgi:hypothetical protein
VKIWKEKTAFDFLVDDAWSVDERLSGVISDAGMVDEFNQLAEDMFPDGSDETAFNDWLRFEDDSILSSLGLEYGKEEEEDQ